MKHNKLFLGLLSVGIATSVIPLVGLTSCNKDPVKQELNVNDDYVYHHTSGYVRTATDTSGSCYISGFILDSQESVSDLTAEVLNVQGLNNPQITTEIEPLYESNCFSVNIYFTTEEIIAFKAPTFDIKISNKKGKIKTFTGFKVYGFTNSAKLESDYYTPLHVIGTLDPKDEYTIYLWGTFRLIVDYEALSAEYLNTLQIKFYDPVTSEEFTDIEPQIIVDEENKTFNIKITLKNFQTYFTKEQPILLKFELTSTHEKLTGWSASRDFFLFLTNDKNTIFKCEKKNGYAVLQHCYCSDETVTIPDEITIDGETLPITKIEEKAVMLLPAKSLILSDNIKTINKGIQNCFDLTKIKFGKNFTATKNNFITNCSALEQIEVSSENETLYTKDNCLIHKEYKSLILGNKNATTVPEGVTSIAPYAFSTFEITSFTIPNTIVEIGSHAFAECIQLSTINFAQDSQMLTIPTGCFSGCFSLTSITLPDNLLTIDQIAFSHCYLLSSITLPSSLKVISPGTFDSCYLLDNVVLPEGLIKINDGAFFECRSLSTISIPSTTESIGSQAFAGCYSLTKIEVASGNKVYFTDANKTCILTKDDLDYTVLVTGTQKTTVIPNNVDIIGAYAFRKQKSLASVDLSNVKLVRKSAFEECDNLATVKLPTANDKYIILDQRCFNDCESIETIDLSHVYYMGNGSFRLCRNLKTVDFGDNNYLTTISDRCFSGCSILPQISIPKTITTIETHAFFNCFALTEVNIPEDTQLSTIGSNAFTSCETLLTITIPATVQKIESSAFSSTGLTSAIFKDVKNWTMNGIYVEPAKLSDPTEAANLLKTTGAVFTHKIS